MQFLSYLIFGDFNKIVNHSFLGRDVISFEILEIEIYITHIA